MAIKVIAPGLSTTVQDLGRPGYYNIGIPLSGGMDLFATRCANMLVGNPESAAVLEAVFLGPELEFTEDAIVAVTGADSMTGGDDGTATVERSTGGPCGGIVEPTLGVGGEIGERPMGGGMNWSFEVGGSGT